MLLFEQYSLGVSTFLGQCKKFYDTPYYRHRMFVNKKYVGIIGNMSSMWRVRDDQIVCKPLMFMKHNISNIQGCWLFDLKQRLSFQTAENVYDSCEKSSYHIQIPKIVAEPYNIYSHNIVVDYLGIPTYVIEGSKHVTIIQDYNTDPDEVMFADYRWLNYLNKTYPLYRSGSMVGDGVRWWQTPTFYTNRLTGQILARKDKKVLPYITLVDAILDVPLKHSTCFHDNVDGMVLNPYNPTQSWSHNSADYPLPEKFRKNMTLGVLKSATNVKTMFYIKDGYSVQHTVVESAGLVVHNVSKQQI